MLTEVALSLSLQEYWVLIWACCVLVGRLGLTVPKSKVVCCVIASHWGGSDVQGSRGQPCTFRGLGPIALTDGQDCSLSL